jgi:hypothetical protein
MTIDVEDLRRVLDGATPGPWTHSKTLVYVGEPDIFDAHGNPEWGGFDIRDCPRPEANATLIAMAPDLAREYLALREAAGLIVQAVQQLDKRKPGDDGGRLVLEVDILNALEAAGHLRAILEGDQ